MFNIYIVCIMDTNICWYILKHIYIDTHTQKHTTKVPRGEQILQLTSRLIIICSLLRKYNCVLKFKHNFRIYTSYCWNIIICITTHVSLFTHFLRTSSAQTRRVEPTDDDDGPRIYVVQHTRSSPWSLNAGARSHSLVPNTNILR